MRVWILLAVLGLLLGGCAGDAPPAGYRWAKTEIDGEVDIEYLEPDPNYRPTAKPIQPAPQPRPVYAQPGYPQPGYPQPGYPQPTAPRTTYPQPTYVQPTYPQPAPSGRQVPAPPPPPNWVPPPQSAPTQTQPSRPAQPAYPTYVPPQPQPTAPPSGWTTPPPTR